MKDKRITITIKEYEIERLEKLMYRLDIKTKSKAIRDLINAYYTQFIMGKEIKKNEIDKRTKKRNIRTSKRTD